LISFDALRKFPTETAISALRSAYGPSRPCLKNSCPQCRRKRTKPNRPRMARTRHHGSDFVAQGRKVVLLTLRYALHVCHREEDRPQEREPPKSWFDVRTKRPLESNRDENNEE